MVGFFIHYSYFHVLLFQRLLVDDVNKVLLCVDPKVGTTTWRTLLINNTLPQPQQNIDAVYGDIAQHGLPYLNTFSNEEILKRLDQYFKVMVVRHPYDR